MKCNTGDCYSHEYSGACYKPTPPLFVVQTQSKRSGADGGAKPEDIVSGALTVLRIPRSYDLPLREPGLSQEQPNLLPTSAILDAHNRSNNRSPSPALYFLSNPFSCYSRRSFLLLCFMLSAFASQRRQPDRATNCFLLPPLLHDGTEKDA